MATITNVVTNPSVEVDTTGFVAQSAPTISRVTTDAWSGTAALRVQVAAASFTGVYQNVTVTATGDWTFSFYINGTAGDGIRTVFYNGTTTTREANHTLATSTWERVVMTANIDNISQPVGLYIDTGNAAQTVDWLIDALLMQAGGSATAYFDGDSAGAVWTGTSHASTSVLTLPDTVATVLVPGRHYVGPLRAGRSS